MVVVERIEALFGQSIWWLRPEQILDNVRAALAEDVRGAEYFGPQGFREMSGGPGRAKIMRWARDEDANQRLWQVSEELTGASWSALA